MRRPKKAAVEPLGVAGEQRAVGSSCLRSSHALAPKMKRRPRVIPRAAALALSYLTTFPEVAQAVDHSKFRTCEQGSFCRRFRKWTDLVAGSPDTYHWFVAGPSPNAPPTFPPSSFHLQNSHEGSPTLDLQLKFYKAGAVRFKVGEIAPIYPRYEIPAGDVVVATAQEEVASGDVKFSTDAEKSTYTFVAENGFAVRAVLQHKPLSFILLHNESPVVVLNRRNLMNFEIYRYQTEKTKLLDAANHPHVDEHGLWAENFGSHHDPKPRGPAGVGLDVTFVGNVGHLFGLPEHASQLDLKDHGEPYRLYNLDVFEYELNSPMALYGAVPMVWAYHKDQKVKRAAGSAVGATTGAPPTQAGMLTPRGDGSEEEEVKDLVSGALWNNPSETFVKVDGAAAGSTLASWFSSQNAAPVGAATYTADQLKGYDTWWVSESGVLDLFLFPGPSPQLVSQQFHTLTGFAPLAPLFALGKHQCRWNYVSQKDLLEVHDKFEGYDIPYDVLWLDIEHTDGKRYFTWDKRHFAQPKEMTDRLSAYGRKLVTIVDPHIKATPDYAVYSELKSQDLLTKKKTWQYSDVVVGEGEAMIKDPSIAGPPADYDPAQHGNQPWQHPLVPNPSVKTVRKLDLEKSPAQNFEGWCWPGQSVYPDFSNPKMRAFWAERFNPNLYDGSTLDTYTWNDMNEPSVFNGPEVSAPRDAVHINDVEHRDNHNLYGMYVQRATFEGHVKWKEGRRPFVLSRSFFTGSHRYGAIWTGDNMANWQHLRDSVAMVLSHALGGISFIGADVGGFFKNPEQELMVRWYQFGAVAYPFFRNHAHIETARREPWTLSKDNLALVKQAVRLRYQILPYYYTLFYLYHATGLPIIRPLWYEFGKDSKVWDHDVMEYQIMVGDSLLTKVVAEPGVVEAKLYLPNAEGTNGVATTWYCWYTYEPLQGGSSYAFDVRGNAPLIARGGKVVPTKFRQRRSASLSKQDPFTLNVFNDPATGKASGKVYVDDYSSISTKSALMEVELESAGSSSSSSSSSLLYKLSGKVLPSATQEGTAGYFTSGSSDLESILTPGGLTVERIVLTGLGEQAVSNLKQVRVVNGGAGAVAGGAYQVQFRVDLLDVVILKLPKVRVDANWEIELLSEAGENATEYYV